MTIAEHDQPAATARADVDDPVRDEQRVVDTLYALLEDEIAQATAALHTATTADIGSVPAARVEREALVRSHRQRLAQLRAAQQRLCFGRIDLADQTTFHVGRVGLADPKGASRALLDWRAPAAAAFYQATGANPMGLQRRRHLRTEGRRVVGVFDELLELTVATGGSDAALDADSALLAALDAPRDGQMHEVVATIQAEQDRIIRAPLRGVLVVQGAPGTGKTVVALHRAAYLLYTYRQQLRSGVLVIGPGSAFLDYIGQVLPSLGENGATLISLGDLHRGTRPSGSEQPVIAALKGDRRMSEVLRRAVAAVPRVPERDVPLDVDGETVLLRPSDVVAAMRPAGAERSPHNVARVVFVREILDRLVRRLARTGGYATDEVVGEIRLELLRSLHASRDVRREVNRCWPLMTPQRLLRRLYRDPDLLHRVAPDLTASERQSLLRDADADAVSEVAWTVADIALLDEAAELLGEDPEPRRRAAAARAAAHADEIQYARSVAQMVGNETLADGERLAAQYTGYDGPMPDESGVDEGGPRTFGHVVVDEAQELTAMQWRAVLRRCPSRSMTVVGDMAQATSPGAAATWAKALRPHLVDRWDTAELTINYRLPRAINDLAHDMLVGMGAAAGTSRARAVREGTDAVRRHQVLPADTTPEALAVTIVGDELAAGIGTVAVVGASARIPALVEALSREASARVSVLTAIEAKGLEFDAVVVVVPDEVLADVGPRGLYVALTRATQRLHIVAP